MTRYTGREAEMAAWAQRQRPGILTDGERRQSFAMEFPGATVADYKRAFGIVEAEPGDDLPI